MAINIFCFTSIMQAQEINDAIRYNNPTGYFSPRSAALGLSFSGIINDNSALIFNPAGLSLINKTEIGLGIGLHRNSTEATYLGQTSSLNSNSQFLSNLSFVSPFHTGIGIASVGIGYFLEQDFNNNYKISAFNNNSSYIGYRAQNDPDTLDLTNFLWLSKRINGKATTPLTKNLQQDALVQESGGLHDIIGSVGLELSKNFGIGVSLISRWGNYKYSKIYTESDTKHNFETFDTNYSNVDLNVFTMNENMDETVTGLSGAVGFVANFLNQSMRLSVNVNFPTVFNFSTETDKDYHATFDDKTVHPPIAYDTTISNYTITTPFIFSFGLSANLGKIVPSIGNLVVTSGFKYSDANELKYNDAAADILARNQWILLNLTGQMVYSFGIEYDLPKDIVPIVIRGSYTHTDTPYSNSKYSTATTTLAGGIGIYLAPNIRLDAYGRSYSTNQLFINYGDINTSSFQLKNSPIDLGLSLVFRF